MAQRITHDQGPGPGYSSRPPRLAALVALVAATGVVSALLGTRALGLVDTLPTQRFEVYLEIPSSRWAPCWQRGSH
ncbi:hypothetical protein NKG05_21455 [Oerskovia sp. M15]